MPAKISNNRTSREELVEQKNSSKNASLTSMTERKAMDRVIALSKRLPASSTSQASPPDKAKLLALGVPEALHPAAALYANEEEAAEDLARPKPTQGNA